MHSLLVTLDVINELSSYHQKHAKNVSRGPHEKTKNASMVCLLQRVSILPSMPWHPNPINKCAQFQAFSMGVMNLSKVLHGYGLRGFGL